MIDKQGFINYLHSKLDSSQIYIYDFKPDLWFLEVDCFAKQSYKLGIEVSNKNIKFYIINKISQIDFPSWHYEFEKIVDAENFIDKIFLEQKFPSR